MAESNTEPKKYTFEEVKQHNTAENGWIIIEGKIYDISKFAKFHPGGSKLLQGYAGQDATEKFNYYHSKRTLAKYAPKLYVGELSDYEAPEQDPKMAMLLSNPKLFGDMVPYEDPNWYQGWNSPYYNDSHKAYRAAVRKFCDEHIEPHVGDWDKRDELPRELFTQLAETGYLKSLLSGQWDSKYGGDLIPGNVKPQDYDWFHFVIGTYEMNRCGHPGVYGGAIAAFFIGLPPVLHHGSDFLKNKICDDVLAARKFICLAITEPAVGSDVANLETTAKLSADGKHYIVNGSKKWITGGMWSDYFTTAVRTGGPGMGGISMLVIERGMPGFSVKKMTTSGGSGSGTSFLVFEDVHVPVENLIGKEGKGFKYIMTNFNTERLGICVQAVALSRVLVSECMKFANKRKTFGKKLMDHAVIRNKLAHMIRQVEATQAWVESVAHQMNLMNTKEQVEHLAGNIALLKAQCTVSLDFCTREAIQVFGGLGYTRGGQGEKVERIFRGAKVLSILGGSEEIMIDLGVRQAQRKYPKSAKL